jgi:hypothetical protein
MKSLVNFTGTQFLRFSRTSSGQHADILLMKGALPHGAAQT